MKELNAMIIDEKDNVAVAIEEIQEGDTVSYRSESGVKTIQAKEHIQIYHKIALADIPKGDPVVKYGEHIGRATCDIRTGQHVHVHNVEGCRENLEAKE